MVDIKKYTDIDLYELIDVSHEATESEIRKAYRKKALSCHPDKNPDNPKAAELFHELSKALEILTDKAARSAYDKVINAKKQAEIRNKQLDSKRKKFKDDLERREKESVSTYRSKATYTVWKTDEERFQAEMERLRKEGNKLLEEEQILMQQQLQRERLNAQENFASSPVRIKIKWKAAKGDKDNGGYTEDILRKYFQKYGDIEALVVSSNKNGSALVEFKSREAGEMAVSYEKGNLNNPLQVEWLVKPPAKSNSHSSSTISDLDYESLVLRQLRQAEERKRLIEQMLKDDGTG